MDHVKSRLLKISSEIAFFAFDLGAESLQINIANNQKAYEITIECHIEGLVEDKLKDLEEQLDVPRREDIEEYLWELLGEDEESRELSLVGMMIDEVKISYNRPLLNIKMFRNK
ncbi:hypothetical protein [Alkaliphilus hydrothermalis]|uniref:Uncharacterized protein n=1 Tax=Alkaliphilus hydrothermalis TaxID=1482730 RepID=A0ABS2NS61_9FIRM|nr:hypothetical protein [Alkaliphilus hydrothermalis]MBM7615666.1 hypothetical protein [Alkaliphilus hydrothermalis]